MSTAQIKALEDYFQLIDRNSIGHVIRTAVDLGVIKQLSEGQKTLTELADTLQLQTDSLRLLMNVLCRTELIEKYGDDYALSTVGRLIPEKYLHLGDHYWQFLSSFVRSGVSLPEDAELPVTDADFELNQASREWTQTPAAMDAAAILEIGEKRTNQRILEIGCGAAVFGAALSHRDTGSQLTLVDRPSALKRAVTTIEGVGLEERVHYLESDYLNDANWVDALEDEEFDLVVIASVLHQLDLDMCRSLIANVARVCHTGTNLAIVDIFPGRKREIFGESCSNWNFVYEPATVGYTRPRKFNSC